MLLGEPHSSNRMYGLSKYYLEDMQNIPSISTIGSQVDPSDLVTDKHQVSSAIWELKCLFFVKAYIQIVRCMRLR